MVRGIKLALMMSTPTKKRRVWRKGYYMALPVLTPELSYLRSRNGLRNIEKYGADYFERIRRGERPSRDKGVKNASNTASPTDVGRRGTDAEERR